MPAGKPIGIPFKLFLACEAKMRVDLHSTIPPWGKVQVQILPDPVCKRRPARLPFCPDNAELGSTTDTCTHSFKSITRLQFNGHLIQETATKIGYACWLKKKKL